MANADVLDGTSDDIVVGDTTVGSGNPVGAGDTVGNPAYSGNPPDLLRDTVGVGNTAVLDTTPEAVGDMGNDVLDDAVDAMDTANDHADGIASATQPIPAPENESTIARILRETTQADPDMAGDFDYFLRSRNRKLTGHETILTCQFAIRFNDAWFQNHLQVEVRCAISQRIIIEHMNRV